ncbi:patatin-like phospholipase family protein [Amycolatopsis cynarae]|uniref:Patatin-like phospholipase family protein n=1 Tax=Amycolatopsis cynarae TaxID=2995223 RepID=A0ABY7B951_9PSEU|nr:patatin-like phospholipase family protein [Amycolatopsis sp. HUAS 11-8]WAL68487.1 patatin-like phospholipase family protein [Amycolatopsis sp. HUAS 11-8]
MARVAVALGSGGARGYAHIGVINELVERGHEIVGVAGSSMGAVVGGVYAAGELAAYTDWVLGLSRRDLLRQLDPSLTASGVIRAERVLARMAEMVGGRRIEELPVRFTAVAVDLLASREVWLDEGPLDRAIRASIGIPGVITPAIVNGRLLVDGGVLNPVPVAATASAHADFVVAVSLQGQRSRQPAVTPTSETAERRPAAEWWDRFRTNASEVLGPDLAAALGRRFTSSRPGAAIEEDLEAGSLPQVGMIEVLNLALDASQAALTRHCLAAHPADVLITVPKDACRTIDFHKAAELVDLGRQLAREALAAW